MKKKEIAKRYGLFVVSLFISAVGVAFTKHGALGVSPISSVANVMSEKLSNLTLGTWLIIWNCALIMGQVLILRKKFQVIQLLQIPLSFLFGWFTDFALWVVNPIPVDIYAVKIIMVIIGVVILSLGVALSVIANVIMNSGEAFVKAVSDTLGKNFGNVKVIFDVSCVVAAVVLSLFFFDMKVIGTREGTIITALLTGVIVKFFTKRLSQPLNAIMAR